MKEYIIGIAQAVILAVATEIIAPEGMKKYISLITGSILLISLINPVLKLKKVKIVFDEIPAVEYNDYNINDILCEEFEIRVEKDIEERIGTEFNIKTIAEIEPLIKDDKIEGVKKINISSQYNEEIYNRLALVYGCTDIKFSGGD